MIAPFGPSSTATALRPPIAPLERLFEASPEPGPARGAALPAELAEAYGGGLSIPLHGGRPTVVANFVSTLDGVVAFDRDGRSGGREVSGSHEPDRFVMGLLRAAADVVLVGAGTVRAGRSHRWIPEDVFPRASEAYAAWRRAECLPALPTTIIVTRGGSIDPGHPALVDPAVPAIVVTSPEGGRRLARAGLAGHVRLVVGDGDIAALALRVAGELRARVVLSEGGPHLIGGLIAGAAVDELFLTVAPQIAGRADDVDRLSLVEGVAFAPPAATWGQLVSARRSGDHLFLRYRFDRPADAGRQQEA